MSRLLIVGMIGGIALLWTGIQELRLGATAKAEPQHLSVSQLEEGGYGDNAHVVISDFALLSFSYVYKGRDRDRMETVWVPMVGLDSEYFETLLDSLGPEGQVPENAPLPQNLGVIMVSSNASSDAALDELGGLDSLQGMITNKIDALDSEEKKLLAESYPSANLDTVWIFEQGRKPAPFVKKAGLTGGGIVLVLLCIGGFIAKARD